MRGMLGRYGSSVRTPAAEERAASAERVVAVEAVAAAAAVDSVATAAETAETAEMVAPAGGSVGSESHIAATQNDRLHSRSTK